MAEDLAGISSLFKAVRQIICVVDSPQGNPPHNDWLSSALCND
jgi:hypothetical protein